VEYIELHSRPKLCLGINEVLGEKKVKKIVGGDNHVVILTTEGKLFGIGNNRDGQLGETEDEYTYLVPLKNFNKLPGKIVDITSGDRNTIALLDDGCLYGTGYNSSGQMGRTEDEIVKNPIKLRYGKKMDEWEVKKVSSGSDFTLMACRKRK